jgi:hypothetical protein
MIGGGAALVYMLFILPPKIKKSSERQYAGVLET